MDNCYCIKIDDPNGKIGYMKYDNSECNYYVEEGLVGACGFDKKQAEEFIEYNGISNATLEKLNLSKVKKVKKVHKDKR